MKKTLDGKKAGLQNARDLKEELLALKMREKKMLEGLSDEASGRNAKTMVRGRLAAAEAKKEEEIDGATWTARPPSARHSRGQVARLAPGRRCA